MKKINCFTSVLFLLLVGCSSPKKDIFRQAQGIDTLNIPAYIRELDNLTVYPADAEPTVDIQFKREATFTDDFGIGTMGNITVDEQGRVFISEGGFKQNRQTIHIFNPDGSYLTTLGRSGEGPGEFRMISDLQVQSNHLFAYDYAQQRINVFSLKPLAISRTIILNPQSWKHVEELEGSHPDPGHYFVRSDNTILFGFSEPLLPDNPDDRYRRYYLLDWEGNIISGKIFEEKDVNFHQGTGIPAPQLADVPTLAFARSSLMAVSDDGYIYTAWTEIFLIKVYDPGGKYLRAFYYPYKKSVLRREDVLERYKNRSRRFQQGVRNTEFPETWPALHYMLLDDENRLWVSTMTDDDNRYEWWVLDASAQGHTGNGRLLARFKWPGRRFYRDIEERKIKLIKNGHLYAVEIDEETGLQKIVRYQIEMN